jgi:hypothetical protein
MPRHQWDDGDDDYRERPYPRRPGMSPVLIIALVVGGLLMLGLVACGVVGLFAWRVAPQPAGQPAAVETGPAEQMAHLGGTKGKRIYARAEFKELVMGKTADEVIAAVGKPDRTEADEFGTYWHYRGRTTDPVTGKTDPDTRLEFKEGRVSEVNF